MGRGFKSGLSSGIPGNEQIELGHDSLEDNALENSINPVKANLLSIAQSEDTKKLINELYRNDAKIGDGGTADAVRYELSTGEKVGGKTHLIKAQERVKQIENMLKKNPNHIDKYLLIELKDNLERALKGE